MVDAPSAFPLAWPPGRPRTATRIEGKFHGTSNEGPYRQTVDLTLDKARRRLRNELVRLGARLPVLSSNDRGRGEPRDPGVAVYFQLDGRPMVMACDRFTSLTQNIAAIAAHIDASRRIDRYGVATTAQMFAGFLALPAPLVVDDWRSALGNPTTLAEAETAFRERIRTAHPDAGGSHAQAAALTEAIRLAREALK
jgi:hypothetical protein